MKQRKTFLGALLLLAVLTLGIGYAAITSTKLEINATASATASDENFKVKFTSDVTSDKTQVSANSTNVTVTPAVAGDKTATLTVSGLTTKDDTITATYTIKNESPELKALITAGNITNSNDEYFSVTSVVNTPTTLNAGATTTVTVTVKLIKTPVDDVDATITIPFEANAA